MGFGTRISAATLLVAGALALAACSPPDAQVTPSADVTAASGRVTRPDAAVTYPRPFQAARLVEAQVRTIGEAGGKVVLAQLDSPLFADSPARDQEVLLAPNWDNRVRLPLGDPVCPAPEGESTVVLTVRVGDRTATEVIVADDTALRTINADECAQQAILDVAQPSFGPVESQTAAEMNTSVVLTRGAVAAEQPVTLTSMTGNIVFIVTLSDEPRTLDPGASSVSVPAIISVGRCDSHVFAESKKTFVFPLYLAVGDAEPAYVEIQPDAVTKQALQDLFDSCGEAERDS